jgi:hypothetical protein
MAGLELIHLGFLAAAAAVAVPLLVHLLLRPRAQRVEIGSLRFLHLALKDSTRQRRVRRWLLLALRALAVLLLALLFARPYLAGSGADGRDRVAILLIDQSASMSATDSGRTLFAAAQQAANKVLEELPAQTAVHLAYFDARGVEPGGDARIDPGRKAGHSGTDYQQALRWARDQIVLTPRRQRQIFLLSDLQRAGVRTEGADELSDLPVTVVQIGKPLVKNLAIVRVEAAPLLIRPGVPIVVTALVRNAGPLPARDVRIRLALEGAEKVQQAQRITVAPLSTQEVRFSLPSRKPGLFTGHVEVDGDDAFSLDDRRWLALDARPPARILLVDGEPGRTMHGNETYYLEVALRLRPSDRGSSLTPYEPVRQAVGDGPLLKDLGRFRLVVLCNVPGLDAEDVTKLRAYVSAGGSLLLFTGGLVQPAGYERLRQAGLLPAAIKGTAEPELFQFAAWEKEHPIFRPLSDPQQGDLRRLAFHRITRLEPAAEARVLATTATSEPLVVERRLGDGTILLVAVPADRDWGPWPQSRLYVPLVHQLVGYLTERLAESQRVRVADTGPGTANPPGITVEGRKVVVRNLDPAESEIERFTVEQFRELFHLAEASTRAKEASAAGARPPGSERPDELWVYVVWALFVILLVEVLVANRTHA